MTPFRKIISFDFHPYQNYLSTIVLQLTIHKYAISHKYLSYFIEYSIIIPILCA